MEQELFTTMDIANALEYKTKNPRRDVLNIAKRLGFTPVATRPREGKNPGGKPEMLWSREQRDAILADNRNRHKEPAHVDSPVKEPHDVSETSPADVTPAVDNHENDSANDTEIDKPATIEPAPAIDTESLIDEPLENKSLEELADEANHYVSCGDECFAQGLTFYLAAGRRLLEAKSRLAHGQWQIWLANNFSASVDTAQNYMKLARRFSSTAKTESIRHLNPTTLIRMLALPEGDEQKFIDDQAEAGNPVEKQSTREIQKNVKQFKQRHAEHEDDLHAARADETAATADDSNTDDREAVSENTPVADTLPAQRDDDISKNSCQSSSEKPAKKKYAELIIDEEFSNILPPLKEHEFNLLEESILRHGILAPLAVWNCILLDGHARYEIAKRHNLPFKIVEVKSVTNRDDAFNWIIFNQLGRRSLNEYQRAALIVKLQEILDGDAKNKPYE